MTLHLPAETALALALALNDARCPLGFKRDLAAQAVEDLIQFLDDCDNDCDLEPDGTELDFAAPETGCVAFVGTESEDDEEGADLEATDEDGGDIQDEPHDDEGIDDEDDGSREPRLAWCDELNQERLDGAETLEDRRVVIHWERARADRAIAASLLESVRPTAPKPQPGGWQTQAWSASGVLRVIAAK